MRRARRTDRKRAGAVAALALACGVAAAALAPAPGAAPAGRPTRADLDAARRRAAVLEAERALTATRQPYVVLDLGRRTLRYSLMGMEVRRIELRGAEVRGLRPAPRDGAPEAPRLAGIVTLARKEDDPRLEPLTPEQIEAGLDDENAADVMPPESPGDYRLTFRQRVRLRVASHGDGRAAAALAAAGRAWSRLADAALRRGGGDALRVALHLDGTTAREVYRSLVPGERLLIVPPPGLVLPDIGQEPAAGIKPGRPAARPVPQPKPEPGVPFQIPPPVDRAGEPPPGGETPPGTTQPGGEAPGTMPPAGAPPEQAPPPGAEGMPEEPAAPEEPEGGPPLPDDWEEAEPEETPSAPEPS